MSKYFYHKREVLFFIRLRGYIFIDPYWNNHKTLSYIHKQPCCLISLFDPTNFYRVRVNWVFNLSALLKWKRVANK